jgi:hypothetical protein
MQYQIEAIKTTIDQYEQAQNGIKPRCGTCEICSVVHNYCNKCLWVRFYMQYSGSMLCYDWLERNYSVSHYKALKDNTCQSEAVREARTRRIMMLKAWLRILEDEDT